MRVVASWVNLGLDSTYKIASKLITTDPTTHKVYTPFESFASVANKYGQIIWYGFMLESESYTQLREPLEGIRDRLLEQYGPSYKPDATYVDNCCNAGVRAALQRIWPGIPVFKARPIPLV